MWAQVENNNVIKVFRRPKALTIGDVNYPSNIFTMWSASELEAIGIYEVVIDNSNLKDKGYYTNTNQSFNFSSGTVTASYGTATALPLDDVLWAEDDEDMPEGTSVGDVKQTGIRQGHIDAINVQAGNILQPTDWMVIRATEGGTAVPSSITTQRAAVRTKANEMCTAINNAANVNALAALYVYTNTGTESDPVYTRPLGELPSVG
jgi:hypothetical protein